MLFRTPVPSLDEVALKAIRCTVKQWVRSGRIARCDADDLEQDIAIHLLDKRNYFDPARASWSTFCSMIANNYLSRNVKRSERT